MKGWMSRAKDEIGKRMTWENAAKTAAVAGGVALTASAARLVIPAVQDARVARQLDNATRLNPIGPYRDSDPTLARWRDQVERASRA